MKTEYKSTVNKHLSRDEICLLYTSDAADERSSVDLGGRRIIKKTTNRKKKKKQHVSKNQLHL